MSRNQLSRYDEFHKGDYLMSNNGEWKAIFQDDGNFVVYGWKPVWASNTCGTDATRLVMQTDCNLVIYNKCGQPKWATGSYNPGSKRCNVYLGDDGILHLFDDGKELWKSSKCEEEK
uniref:Lectin n=1 Tax=Fundulus heteroclitus TaxID=8078 RepID=A0A147AZ46_FUNHE